VSAIVSPSVSPSVSACVFEWHAARWLVVPRVCMHAPAVNTARSRSCLENRGGLVADSHRCSRTCRAHAVRWASMLCCTMVRVDPGLPCKHARWRGPPDLSSSGLRGTISNLHWWSLSLSGRQACMLHAARPPASRRQVLTQQPLKQATPTNCPGAAACVQRAACRMVSSVGSRCCSCCRTCCTKLRADRQVQ
jgi:hypothetical protein